MFLMLLLMAGAQTGLLLQDICCHKRHQTSQQKRPTFIISGVFNKVILEHTHEDGGQESREQQHCDTGVNDAEPMDLQGTQLSPISQYGLHIAKCLLAVCNMLSQ